MHVVDLQETKNQLRKASFVVLRLYPGPVGEYLQRELLALEEHTWLFQNMTASSPIHRMVKDILEQDAIKQIMDRKRADYAQ